MTCRDGLLLAGWATGLTGGWVRRFVCLLDAVHCVIRAPLLLRECATLRRPLAQKNSSTHKGSFSREPCVIRADGAVEGGRGGCARDGYTPVDRFAQVIVVSWGAPVCSLVCASQKKRTKGMICNCMGERAGLYSSVCSITCRPMQS